MHVYSSILDPYEPPRPRRVYDNAQVAKRRRSLLSALFEGLKNREVAPRRWHPQQPHLERHKEVDAG
jgi:hypothetical protein